jgi:hypothetical protein
MLSQINSVHITASYRSRIHFNIIHPNTSWSSYRSLSFWLSHQYPTLSYMYSSLQFVVQALPFSSLTRSFCLYLAGSTIYEAPQYAVFSNLLSPQLSLVQIFSPAPCYQTTSVYISPAISETKFHTHTEPQAK